GRSFATEQAYILDLVAQAVLHHRITPGDDGWHHLFIPEQKPTISRVGVQDKAHADIIAFPFHAIKASAFAAKAHPFGLADTDAIGCLIGTGGKRLGHRTIDMVSDPRDTSTLGILMQLVF